MPLGLLVPFTFPSFGSVCRRPPYLHRVSAGLLPRLPRYYLGAKTPCRPSRFASFPSLPSTASHPFFARSGRRALAAWRQEYSGFAPEALRCPAVHSAETTGSPRFLGDPLCTCPALRPRREPRARPYTASGLLPSVMRTTSAPSPHEISGLNHTACAPTVYASQGGLPHHHARLVSGCRPALPGGVGYPLGPNARFRRCSCHLFLLAQALPGAISYLIYSVIVPDKMRYETLRPLLFWITSGRSRTAGRSLSGS